MTPDLVQEPAGPLDLAAVTTMVGAAFLLPLDTSTGRLPGSLNDGPREPREPYTDFRITIGHSTLI